MKIEAIYFDNVDRICYHAIFYGVKNMNDFTLNNIALSPRALIRGKTGQNLKRPSWNQVIN